ncbi:hypothetical protein [Sandaracinobacteroides saxicola]|uniref:CopG family transcriptional regulator n=1 Tax=Sandaracinobacteroides saxicola TaxID=2759707 RepID=A0A7G5IEB3_9SPHN|nr:hypothetical protein [Sandaracinobacteroides saxicola]QMW21705.1 hypothetical protein H3309_09780 [Sandaracinobacteroides saxicola]
MTTIEVTLPDALASEAKSAGLFDPGRMEILLRNQLRVEAVDRLFADLAVLDATAHKPLTPEEVTRELAAVRRARAA